MTKPTTNAHPAKTARQPRKPDPKRDGFSTNSGTALQLERTWRTRDCPVEERVTHERVPLWKPK
jgi:hypothetical protein